jgi:PII-like signaling protein
MRLSKPIEIEGVSQTLAKGNCPVCAFLKNSQSALLQGGLAPEEVSGICNFHAWALAAAVNVANAAKVFQNLLRLGENDKWHGKSLQEALVEALRANEIAGVTVYRGILGYGANRRIHKDKTLGLSQDRPIMLAVIDTEAKLAAFTPILDQMLQQGLVVLSDVDVIKYTHDYKATERRQEVRQ